MTEICLCKHRKNLHGAGHPLVAKIPLPERFVGQAQHGFGVCSEPGCACNHFVWSKDRPFDLIGEGAKSDADELTDEAIACFDRRIETLALICMEDDDEREECDDSNEAAEERIFDFLSAYGDGSRERDVAGSGQGSEEAAEEESFGTGVDPVPEHSGIPDVSRPGEGSELAPGVSA